MNLQLNSQNRAMTLPMVSPPPHREQFKVWIGLLLLVLVGIIYGQTYNFDLINYDDAAFITQDPFVSKGVTWEGLEYAFSTSFPFFMPLNRLATMIQFELFSDVYIGGYHLSNVLIHLLNAMILFHLLDRMTGKMWSAALVALLFAVHPVHVEAVAWVSELREVMSFFFGFLAMVNYVTVVTLRDAPFTPENHRGAQHAFRWLLFNTICSLLAKPMWVTFPFLLLLMDWWPLNRTHRPIVFLVKEKASLFLLTLFFSSLTILSYRSFENLASLDDLTLATRLGNLLTSWAIYLGKTFIPIELGLIYPYYNIDDLAWWQLAGAVAIPVVITGVAWRLQKNHPWLIMGWFWFVGTLLPVSGIINGGNLVAMTDRWSYLPHVGLFIALAWELSYQVEKIPARRFAVVTVSSVFILFCTMLAWMQTSHWRDSVAIWQKTADVTAPKRQAFALYMLSMAYIGNGENKSAFDLIQQVVDISPNDPTYLNYLAILQSRMNHYDEAFNTWEKMVHIPRISHVTLAEAAKIMLVHGTYDRAANMYEQALERTPGKEKRSQALIHFYLARSLLGHEKAEEAASHLHKFFQLDDVEMKKKCELAQDTVLETKNYQEFIENWQPIKSYCDKIDSTG